MIGTLIRRDPAFKIALTVLPFALVHGYTMRVSAHAAPLKLWVTWAFIVALLAFSSAHRRCGEFAMGLPIAARKLWLLRTGVLTGAGLLLVAGVAVFPLALRGAPVSDFLNLGASVLLGLAWIQSWTPRKNSLSGWGFVLYSTAGLAGAIWLSVWLTRESAWMALAPLGAALLLGVRTYMAVPQGFELHTRAGERGAEVVVGPWSGRFLVPRLLYEWYWWALFVVFFVVGALPASEEAMPIMVFALATSLAPVALKLPQVGHLPISRRRLFAWATLPAVLSYFTGLFAGRMIHGPRGPHSWLMVYEPRGPETLQFVHLRADLAVVAVLTPLAALIWLVMVLVSLGRQGVPPVTRRGAWMRRLRWGGLIAACLLALPVMAMLLTDEYSLFGKPGEALSYYFALAVVRVAGVFPWRWVAVPAALAALAGIYLWGERRFRRAEALTPRGPFL